MGNIIKITIWFVNGKMRLNDVMGNEYDWIPNPCAASSILAGGTKKNQ